MCLAGLGWGTRQNLHSRGAYILAGDKGPVSTSWWINYIFGGEES